MADPTPIKRPTKFSDVADYFEKLAENHVEINHTNTEKHFFRLELDELLTALPTTANFPALILEGYDIALSDPLSDNAMKKRNGAFVLMEHLPDPGDYQDIDEKWDFLEEIADDIIALMKEDSKDRTNPAKLPIRSIDLDSITGTLFISGNTIGIRYTYAIEGRFNSEVNTKKWKHLQNG